MMPKAPLSKSIAAIVALATTACAGSSLVWDETVPFPLIAIGCWGEYQERIGDWSNVDPVGWIYDEGEEGGWVFFPDHGWMFVSMGAGTGSCDEWWLYSPETGWYWSSTAYYPWMWSDDVADWVHVEWHHRVAPSLYAPITDVTAFGLKHYYSTRIFRFGPMGLLFEGGDRFRYFEFDIYFYITATADSWSYGSSQNPHVYAPADYNAYSDTIYWHGTKLYLAKPVEEPQP